MNFRCYAYVFLSGLISFIVCLSLALTTESSVNGTIISNNLTTILSNYEYTVEYSKGVCSFSSNAIYHVDDVVSFDEYNRKCKETSSVRGFTRKSGKVIQVKPKYTQYYKNIIMYTIDDVQYNTITETLTSSETNATVKLTYSTNDPKTVYIGTKYILGIIYGVVSAIGPLVLSIVILSIQTITSTLRKKTIPVC